VNLGSIGPPTFVCHGQKRDYLSRASRALLGGGATKKTVHKQVQSKMYKAQGALTAASTTNRQTQVKTVSKTFHKRSKINLRK